MPLTGLNIAPQHPAGTNAQVLQVDPEDGIDQVISHLRQVGTAKRERIFCAESIMAILDELPALKA